MLFDHGNRKKKFRLLQLRWRGRYWSEKILNQWYSLKAYYLAKTLAEISFQIVFPTVYLIPIYFMSNQPMSIESFSMLLGIMISMALVGQGVGLFFGAAFEIPVASYFAPIS